MKLHSRDQNSPRLSSVRGKLITHISTQKSDIEEDQSDENEISNSNQFKRIAHILSPRTRGNYTGRSAVNNHFSLQSNYSSPSSPDGNSEGKMNVSAVRMNRFQFSSYSYEKIMKRYSGNIHRKNQFMCFCKVSRGSVFKITINQNNAWKSEISYQLKFGEILIEENENVSFVNGKHHVIVSIPSHIVQKTEDATLYLSFGSNKQIGLDVEFSQLFEIKWKENLVFQRNMFIEHVTINEPGSYNLCVKFKENYELEIPTNTFQIKSQDNIQTEDQFRRNNSITSVFSRSNSFSQNSSNSTQVSPKSPRQLRPLWSKLSFDKTPREEELEFDRASQCYAAFISDIERSSTKRGLTRGWHSPSVEISYRQNNSKNDIILPKSKSRKNISENLAVQIGFRPSSHVKFVSGSDSITENKINVPIKLKLFILQSLPPQDLERLELYPNLMGKLSHAEIERDFVAIFSVIQTCEQYGIDNIREKGLSALNSLSREIMIKNSRLDNYTCYDPLERASIRQNHNSINYHNQYLQKYNRLSL
eukprot:gb/GECH01014781.1/.p1 GENE.gb/GECH01014781.1/~~gb/GECH01014781.1/.p1  ORF type:complete len:533 (+),score=132.16 gb/GECH01014781.1/:1-1599(+)